MAGQKIIHHLIAKTAKELANEAYELMARDNDFRQRWPSRRHFVRKCWDVFIPDARQALVAVLASPHIHEHLKEPVYEALLIDGNAKAVAKPPLHSMPAHLH